jgi:hypothetical protein
MEQSVTLRGLTSQPLVWVASGIVLALVGVPLALGTGVGELFWVCAFFGAFLSLTGTIALGVSLGIRHARSG